MAVQDREQFIASLRELADFMEQNPQVEAPQYTSLNVFVNTKEEIAKYAELGSWKKEYTGGFFALAKQFGTYPHGIKFEVNCGREQVCRKVVTGTEIVPAKEAYTREIVEWVCDEPLLG